MNPTKKYTAKELLILYESGLNTTQISKKTKMSLTSVKDKLASAKPNYKAIKRHWPVRLRALLLYILKPSLRGVSKQIGVDHTTIGDWLYSIHPDYSKIARRGAIVTISDYLNSIQAKRHPNKAKEVRDWLEKNLLEIFSQEANNDLMSFSNKEERNRSFKETGSRRDFRENI